eukprot:TRINITY_DN3151_c0_g1_i10.p1 TRINITY_DN3151_c0_g1~~TRINITY_DN3151_c0_g1_i10.p1  ORF type:complete len:153 (-),score=21.56 TRINITY_DN3151_c0_g1_i10:50-508(-)
MLNVLCLRVGDEESVSSGQARSEKEQRSTRHTNPLSTLTNFVGNAVGNAVSTAANATAQAVRRTVDLQSQPLIYSKKANTSIPLQVRVIHQIVYVLHAKNLLQLCLSNNGLLSRIFEVSTLDMRLKCDDLVACLSVLFFSFLFLTDIPPSGC